MYMHTCYVCQCVVMFGLSVICCYVCVDVFCYCLLEPDGHRPGMGSLGIC